MGATVSHVDTPRPPSATTRAVRRWRGLPPPTAGAAVASHPAPSLDTAPSIVGDELARRARAAGAGAVDEADPDALLAALRADAALLRRGLAAVAAALGVGEGGVARDGAQTARRAEAGPAPAAPRPPPRPATAPAALPPPRPPPPPPGAPPVTPDVARWLAAHEPLAIAVAEAAAAGRSRDAEAALAALCAREGVAPADLQPCAASLGFDPADVVARGADLAAALATLADEAGYESMARSDADLAVFYRHAPPSPIHSVQFATVFDASIIQLLSLVAEVDLLPQWNKFCVEARALGRPWGPVWALGVYAACWIPPPFPQFDSTIRVWGHDAGDGPVRGLVLTLTSVDGDAGAGLRPPDAAEAAILAARPARAAKRHSVLIGAGSCIKLLPVAPAAPGGPPRTHGTLAVHLDPRLPFVPRFLVAWVLRVLSPYILRSVRRVMATWFAEPGTAAARAAGAHAGTLPARIRARADAYGVVERLVAARVEEGGGLPPPPPERTARRPPPPGLTRRLSASAGGAAKLFRRLSSMGEAGTE